MVDREIPAPAPNEVLIKVKVAGICGTDVHIYMGEYFGGHPRVPGHEFCGVVKKDGGKNINRFYKGQRVSVDPNIFCEECSDCQQNKQNFCENFGAGNVTKDGVFAQYVIVPANRVFDIGESVKFSEGAIIEPLVCVIHGQEIARHPIGSSVLIIGAGPIGLMHIACINGAAAVLAVDGFPKKPKIAKNLELIQSIPQESLRA